MTGPRSSAQCRDAEPSGTFPTPVIARQAEGVAYVSNPTRGEVSECRALRRRRAERGARLNVGGTPSRLVVLGVRRGGTSSPRTDRRVRQRRRTAAALGVAAALLAPARAAAQADAVTGRVVEAPGGAPIAAAQVALVDGGRTATTGADGRFALAGAGRGAHAVTVRRIGYAPETVRLEAGVPTDVRLRATALALPSMTVRAPGRERRLGDAVALGTVLEGAALDRQLAASVAATVAGEPGVTMRTNGPMAAQPVVRGLTGDRVLVLEDGQRTGDVATTAPDHAVTIDPLTARRVGGRARPRGAALRRERARAGSSTWCARTCRARVPSASAASSARRASR
jgi:hypothetical protein